MPVSCKSKSLLLPPCTDERDGAYRSYVRSRRTPPAVPDSSRHHRRANHDKDSGARHPRLARSRGSFLCASSESPKGRRAPDHRGTKPTLRPESLQSEELRLKAALPTEPRVASSAATALRPVFHGSFG